MKKPEIKSEDTEAKSLDQSSFEEKEDSSSYKRELNNQNNTIKEDYGDQKKENEIKVEVEKTKQRKLMKKVLLFLIFKDQKKKQKRKSKK